jgi:hypothetical protein
MFWKRRDRDAEYEDRVERRREKRAGTGPPLVRAIFTLIGVGVAGFLIWLATLFELDQTGEFWVAMALVAGAGLALGLSQLFGGWTKWGIPVLSPGVFLFAFVPTAVIVGWLLLATQPEGGWQQSRFEGWSDDLGILGFVQDMGLFSAALAMGLGIVLAFSFDTTGPRTREIDSETYPYEDVHDYERREVVTSPTERTVVREEESVSAGATRDEGAVRDRRDLP